MLLPVTLVAAAVAALINLWLALRVSRQRLAGRTMVGEGSDPVLQVRSRAHANFIEYAPFVVILTGLVELARGPNPWLWAIVALFAVGRLLHPFGMERPAPNPLRAGGIVATWLALLALAIWALAIAYGGTRPEHVPTTVEQIVPSA